MLLAELGLRRPSTLPLCFAPEAAGQAMVVCPTEQSAPYPTDQGSGAQAEDVADAVLTTANRVDLLLVELVGLAAAAIAAAAATRGIRGSFEPHGLPVALALLKLPTGALTALLGLLLVRGGFVPWLTALDTSAQIPAWALVFGLRAAAVHPPGRPAGAHRARDRPRGRRPRPWAESGVHRLTRRTRHPSRGARNHRHDPVTRVSRGLSAGRRAYGWAAYR